MDIHMLLLVFYRIKTSHQIEECRPKEKETKKMWSVSCSQQPRHMVSLTAEPAADIYFICILKLESGCFEDALQELYSDCFIADGSFISLRGILERNTSLHSPLKCDWMLRLASNKVLLETSAAGLHLECAERVLVCASVFLGCEELLFKYIGRNQIERWVLEKWTRGILQLMRCSR